MKYYAPFFSDIISSGFTTSVSHSDTDRASEKVSKVSSELISETEARDNFSDSPF
jgi:hypothetical protein